MGNFSDAWDWEKVKFLKSLKAVLNSANFIIQVSAGGPLLVQFPLVWFPSKYEITFLNNTSNFQIEKKTLRTILEAKLVTFYNFKKSSNQMWGPYWRTHTPQARQNRRGGGTTPHFGRNKIQFHQRPYKYYLLTKVHIFWERH